MEQAVAMLRPTAQGKQVGLEVALDSRIPLVFADPDRILEVLINLMDNAIKFTGADGSVILSACVTETDPGSVYVSVTDTGRGIGLEAQALIFERLYQDPESVDNNRKGLGLGLFICKELLRLQGGRIWVTSDPGHGSVFTFTLPLYSLAELLRPVIVQDEALRAAFVLVRVELTPITNPPRGDWREVWQQALETLRHCVYLDKDLVLPPMWESGASETFFVVASVDMEHAGVMSTRIRKLLERIPDLTAKSTLTITSAPVELGLLDSSESLEMRVDRVAGRVTEMIMASIGRKSPGNGVKNFN
jgi:hypothetical protein